MAAVIGWMDVETLRRCYADGQTMLDVMGEMTNLRDVTVSGSKLPALSRGTSRRVGGACERCAEPNPFVLRDARGAFAFS